MFENEVPAPKAKRPYPSVRRGRRPDPMSRFGLGFGVVALPGRILVSANAAFLEILGFTSLRHAKSWDLLALAQDSHEAVEILEEISRTGKLRTKEMKARRLDGRGIWISFSANALNGRSDRLEVLLEDITDRKLKSERLAAEAILTMKSETLESIATLSGGLAHDINNLLTPIVGYSDLLLQKVGPESAIRCELSEIQTAAGRVVEIVQNLLAFGRRQVINQKRVDLNAEIRSLIPDIRKELGQAVELRVAIAEEACPILGDARQIKHVLACLVSNAKEAMPEGGVLEIETDGFMAREPEGGGLRPGAYSVLTVKDSGIGMNAEIQAHVFEPFFTTKRLYKGAGLGLSVVYGIVKQCHGHIRIESAQGKGTAFRLFFPAGPLPRVKEAPLPAKTLGVEA
jgi:two-component system, cell cycle sensor histidine kinase and response regulator CckA